VVQDGDVDELGADELMDYLNMVRISLWLLVRVSRDRRGEGDMVE
jgi:hypothetical protein